MKKQLTGHSVECCGCSKELDDRNVEHDFYGTYRFDVLIEGVCCSCYEKGIRTEAQKKAQNEGGKKD